MELQHLADLGVETTSFARSVAMALTVMQRHSLLDARDVEFVLEGRPAGIHHFKPGTANVEATMHFRASYQAKGQDVQ